MEYVAIKDADGVDTGRIRNSDDALHRAAGKYFHEADHVQFRMLPAVIAQIIEYEVWKTRDRRFESFADYALDTTSNGLGVHNDQHLWQLKCAMDIHDKHVKQWAQVLAKVETMVKAYVVADGKRVRDFNGNSLEKLAKEVAPGPKCRITYLPSRQTAAHDGHLIRLQRNHPELFQKVIDGEITMAEARKAAGLKVGKATPLEVIVRLLPKLSSAERQQLKAMLD
jgi:hypothetical protein